MPRPRSAFRRKILTKKYAALEGLPDLVARLNSLGEAVEADEVYAVLMHGAMVVRDEAKSLAPYDPKRKKGIHLRDAIFASEGDPSKDRRGPTVIAGVGTRKAPHARLIEKGTSKMAARPFWRPGVNAARPAVANIIADGLKKIIADAVLRKSFS